uniref:Reverse transcriptase domain-containing protein n=1 Tax=Oreochromis niloticus TaxID=8128 RepID=A0A669ET24_ORENI
MGREHKISLFADDILIYLTNPNITFPKLLSLLETFGSLSGYKLNILKTQILTFNYKPNQEIKSKVNLNWESEWMKYLGVNITKDLSKLYNANFNPLCYKFRLHS